MGAQECLIMVSAGMLIPATVIMIRAIVKKNGHKSAHLIPWLIWAAVTLVTVGALLHTNTTRWELVVPLSQLGSMFCIILATAYVIIKRRTWRKERLKLGEGLALGVCVVSVCFGLYFKEPYIVLLGNFAANIVGLVPLYREGRANPDDVTRSYWIFRGFSTTAATAACLVEGLSLALLIPSSVGMIIFLAMLRASAGRPMPSHVLRTVRSSDEHHPMLTVGITFH